MEQLIGKVPVEINQTEYRLDMTFSDGSKASWYHSQDCCEVVEIAEVIGDFEDLIGNPLLVAEGRDGEGPADLVWDESHTWTFYTFRGIGGSVDVRWLGQSNGYYSEDVYFDFTPPSTDAQ